MRRTLLPAVLAVVLTMAGTAQAGGGLPTIVTLEAGTYHALLYNDSPELQQGANTLTLDIPGLPPEATATLRLIGPNGLAKSVPLKPLIGAVATAHGHGEEADAHGHEEAAPAATDSHGHEEAASTTTDSHGHEEPASTTTDSHGHDDSDTHATEEPGTPTYTARGKVTLDTTGDWTVILDLQTPDGPLSTSAPVHVVYGGPNRIFLGAAGLLMGGTVTYGIIQRRRQTTGRR